MSLGAPGVRPGTVLADALIDRTRVRDVALVLGGAAFTGLAAQLVVPIPGTPVPVSAQTLAVLLVGTVLGAGRGAAALGVYLAAGAAGMPWFADGGSGTGGASFGYVLGFVLAAAMTGALARRGGDRTPLRTAGVMVLGNLAIYAVGVPWLMAVAGVGLAEGLALGLVPFLVGDAVKLALAMGALPTAWRLVGRRG